MATIEAPVNISYRTIRQEYQTPDLFIDRYTQLLSPLFTAIFVRFGVIPNVVTVLMMVSGVAGAALFALPWILAKAVGLLFIHLWYILDCSDGEVARVTRRFSKLGAEIDYTAHLVCHPFFNLSFAWNLISLHRYNTQLILFVAIVCISAEMMLRNLISLRLVYERKLATSALPGTPRGIARRMVAQAMQAIYLYPNFALLFPVAYIIDYSSDKSIALIYMCLFTVTLSIVTLRAYVLWIKRIVLV